MTENNTKHTAYKIAAAAILLLLLVSIFAVAPASAYTTTETRTQNPSFSDIQELWGLSNSNTWATYSTSYVFLSRYDEWGSSFKLYALQFGSKLAKKGIYSYIGGDFPDYTTVVIPRGSYTVEVTYPEGTLTTPAATEHVTTVDISYTYADIGGKDLYLRITDNLAVTGTDTTILLKSAATSGSGTYTWTLPKVAPVTYTAYLQVGETAFSSLATTTFEVTPATTPTPTPTPTPSVTPTTTPKPSTTPTQTHTQTQTQTHTQTQTQTQTQGGGTSGTYLGFVTAAPSTTAVGEKVSVSYSVRKSGQWSTTDNVYLEVVNPEHYGVSRLLRLTSDSSNQFDYQLKYAGDYSFRIVSDKYPNFITISESHVTASGETPSEYLPMETEGLRATQTTVDSSESINIDYYTSEAGEISIRENGKVIYTKTHAAAGGGTIGLTHITTDTDKTYTYKLYRGTTEIGSITLTWRAAPYNPPEIAVSGHISTTAPRGEGIATYSLNVGETATVTYRLKSPGEASLRYSEEYPSFKNNNRVIDIDTATYKGETASISGSFEVKYDKPGYYTYYLWAGDDYRLNGVAYPVSTLTICVNSNPTTGVVRIDEVTAYVGSRLPVHYDGYSDNGEIGLYVMKPSTNSYELVAGMAQDFGTFIAALFNRPVTLTGKIDYTFDEVGTYTFAMYKGKANELTSSNLLGSDTIVIMQIPTPEALSDDFWGLGSYDGTYDIANYLQAVNWIRQVSVPSSIVTHFNIKSPSAYMSAYDVPYQSVSWFDNSIGQLITGLYNIVNTLSFPIRYVFNVTFGVINAFGTTFGWATSQLSIPIMLITLVTELIPDEIMNVALLLFGFDLFFLVLTVVAPGLVASASAVMGRNGFQRMDTPDEPPSEAESKKHEEAKTNAGVLNSNTEYNGFIDNMMDGK